jgi:dihydropyrimidinase
MRPMDTVIKNGTIVRPREGTFKADLGIRDGRIAAIGSPGELDGHEVHDVDGLYVLPGVVDPHAHIGMGGGMDEYTPDTGAAAIGGVTTVFYILIHPGSYREYVAEHLDEAVGTTHTDFGYHVTLMTDDHVGELDALAEDYGIRSYKYYMSFRGDEGAYLGVESTDDGQFLSILAGVAKQDGVLAVHPENIEIVWRLRDRLISEERDGLKSWNESRPPFTEAEAILRAAYLGSVAGCRLYFVHCSCAAALDAVLDARARYPNLDLYAETCPHFLTHHDGSDVGILGKVNPPLRTPEDNMALWRRLVDGSIDTVGSDHVGRRREKKQGTIWTASAGFPGLPTTLPVLLSEGHLKRGVPLERIAEATSQRPAEIFGLADRKGDIRIGLDADLAIIDLSWTRRPRAEALGTWSDYSLYEDVELTGWPRLTFLGGQLVQQDGEIVVEAPLGGYLGG